MLEDTLSIQSSLEKAQYVLINSEISLPLKSSIRIDVFLRALPAVKQKKNTMQTI